MIANIKIGEKEIMTENMKIVAFQKLNPIKAKIKSFVQIES